MSISPDASYRLIYAQAPFAQNLSFLEGLKSRFPTVEVPYLEAMHFPEEEREPFDQYLYVRNDPDAAKVIAAVKQFSARGRAFPARMDDLGVVSGKHVRDMLDRFQISQQVDTVVGEWYRVTAGAYRNLIVRLTDRNPASITAHNPIPWDFATESDSEPVVPSRPPGDLVDPVVVEYWMFERYNPLVVSKQDLAATRAPVEFSVAFTNYLTHTRHKRAVILDGDTKLREACCLVDNLYTRPEPGSDLPYGKYVGGDQGFYFTISRFRMLRPHYELHVVFDEREGGPLAGKGSPTFEAAFAENRDWCKRYAAASGLHVYSIPGQRSEDVIASLSRRMLNELDYRDVIVVTKGTELYPLVSDRLQLVLPKINFRDHPLTIKVPEALEHFGLSHPDQLPRIQWLRAINGDVADTPSVNLYNKTSGHRYLSIRREDYLPHILAARDLNELKLRLLTFEAFQPFIHSGQLDRNLAAIAMDTTVLDGLDLGEFRRRGIGKGAQVDVGEIATLLREVSFHKEIEFLPWQTRITRGLW